jgi:hypothetical protein
MKLEPHRDTVRGNASKKRLPRRVCWVKCELCFFKEVWANVADRVDRPKTCINQVQRFYHGFTLLQTRFIRFWEISSSWLPARELTKLNKTFIKPGWEEKLGFSLILNLFKITQSTLPHHSLLLCTTSHSRKKSKLLTSFWRVRANRSGDVALKPLERRQ